MAAPKRVNPTEFAILGLIAESPRSGYDIKREVEGRLAHFWSESYGHLYPMLKRLRARKLITRQAAVRRGGRARHEYAITPAGRRALAAWFATPLQPARPRNELLLRLQLGRFAPPGALRRDLAEYRARLREGLARLRAVEAELADSRDPDVAYWRLSISFGTQLYETLEKWCERASRELGRVAG